MTHQHFQSHSLERYLAFKFKPPRNTTSCPSTPITNQYSRSTVDSTTPKRSLLRDHAKHKKQNSFTNKNEFANITFQPKHVSVSLKSLTKTIPEALQQEPENTSSSKPPHVHPTFRVQNVNLQGVVFLKQLSVNRLTAPPSDLPSPVHQDQYERRWPPQLPVDLSQSRFLTNRN